MNSEDRLLRLPDIIGDRSATPPIPALIPISKTAWYEGVKAGRFPKPIRLGPRTTVWRLSDVLRLMDPSIGQAVIQ